MGGILQLQAENVRRIKAVDIKPDSAVVRIAGDNGAGKSSVLDSILWAFNGKKNIPKSAIRRGSDKAKIVVDIGEYKITRTITESDAYLKIENKDGLKMQGAQSFLDTLFGDLSFDPMAFARSKPEQMARILRDIAGVDTTKIDERSKEAYDERRMRKRTVGDLEHALNIAPFHPDAPDELVDDQQLLDDIAEANETNRENERTRAERDATAERVERLRAELKDAEARLEDLETQCGNMPDEPIDTDAMRKRLRDLDTTNQMVRENAERAAVESKLDNARKLVEHSQRVIDECAAERDQMLADARFPIEGLGIDPDGYVVFNDIPFDQISTAEQIRVSVAMGLALNPKVPIILIRDGSLLDDRSMADIERMAGEHDAQIWIERVGDDPMAIIIEDGSVRGADPEPEPAAEESE